MTTRPKFNILANCALYYYRDLAAATNFYQDTLGFELAEDYGFGKLFQVASTSYLMLVDASIGRHSADEPKTVTTALLTDELEGWWNYLSGLDLPMRAPFNYQPGKAHDGFVIIDPEGYYLEFERFNPHSENELMMPLLEPLPSRYPSPSQHSTCPVELGIKGTVTWLYYQDLEQAGQFWQESFGLPEIIDQGFAKVFHCSPSGFIGPVRAGNGLHPYTAEKGVTVSLFTNAVDEWFAHLRTTPNFVLQDEKVVLELGRVRDFLGLDPECYFIELNEFIEHSENTALRTRLGLT